MPQCTLPWAPLCLVLLTLACSSESPSDPPQQEAPPTVVIGVPAGEDELDFAALEPGTELQLETFFQGGTHATLAIRCIGLSNRAFVRASVENLATGVQVETTTSTTNPRPLICRDDVTCDFLPFLVMMTGVAESNAELNGLEVEITATAENTAGVSATDKRRVELRTDNLDL